MNADNQSAKIELRAIIRSAIKNLSPEKRKSDSEKICALLKTQPFFQTARSILFFAPLPEEPDLWPVVNETMAGKQMVALPCFDPENQVYQPRRVTDLHVEILSGKFGIREPVDTCVAIPPNDLDLVLVPGVAFGLDGHRLGRGKGYYDRLLQYFTGKKIGIAFDEQIVDAVPSEENDVRMDLILTPTRCVKPQ
ncbi:MAG TPA: 5-formyltetrahydrofolate cyclo-ligase [Verrucomicrobiae bacterium]|jgi:5-formyltetrahydrofolate cyclo-ligase|nr:5-formyltetrahydrofolate cyclo-ligase [Verrucomicrobiae bacterium]